MKNKLFLFLILATINSSAQECNCPESFDWMVDIFEKNDAGFQYVIDKKGVDDYSKHNLLFKEKTKTATTLNDCQAIMYGWLRYFRPGHIGVGIKENSEGNNEVSSVEIRQRYKDAPKIDLTEKQLIAILEKKTNKNSLEGIWSNGNYKIGIIAKGKSTKEFAGFIIKADSIFWMPKQVKVEFSLNESATNFTATYYMLDHSKQATEAKFINKENTLLSLYGNYWTREYPKSTLSVSDELLVAFSQATEPFVKKLSEKTIYLRIPSFAAGQKKYIDSVVAKYDKQISSSPNLIIDIRNGTGGSDASYDKILPYLYTQPIRGIGVSLYSTELNAKAYEGYSKFFDDTSNINYCNRVAAKMRANTGKFITMSEQKFGIDTLEKVLPFPQKVAIICNQNNGSTDEQFLLDAKQSTKVKVFGRPTGGMLDISNMNSIDFPNGKFSLGYCMSRSFRIPNYCIDGVGIQPDYFIDDAINENNWIEYTRSVIEE